MPNNEEYIQEYIETRGLSPKTHQSLKSILNHYCKFQQATLQELLTEADQEEEQRIRWKHRQLKNRLITYMNHLKNTMDINSAKTYLIFVKSFYNHHEIEIGKIPTWNKRNAIILEPILPSDLPDKKIIQQAVTIADPLMRALILFLTSTGMSKVDTLKLTIQDFIKATYKHHKKDNMQEALKILLESADDIIPVWQLRRTKTNKYFITFNTPETTVEILNYLQNRMEKQTLKPTDKLFKISEHYYTVKFEQLNNAMGLGTVGNGNGKKGYNRFRGHMLRKYHATQLEKNGMNRPIVNVLQGKSNNAVDDVYFYEDTETLKEEYIKAMSGLLILSEAKIVNQYSDEYRELVKENELLRKQSRKISEVEEEIQRIKSWWIRD